MKHCYFFFSVFFFSSCIGENSDLHKTCGEELKNSTDLCNKKINENSKLEFKLQQANNKIGMLEFEKNNQDKVEALQEPNFAAFEH